MTVYPLFGGPTCVVLTGSPMVTSPYNLTTFRCENWPMTAASCRGQGKGCDQGWGRGRGKAMNCVVYTESISSCDSSDA